MKNIMTLVVVGLVIGIGIVLLQKPKAEKPEAFTQTPIVDVVVPTLSEVATAGRQKFAENCAMCHGTDAAGNDGFGPPLIHKIYEPNHHGNQSFALAFVRGVPAHHWNFGDMPAQPQIDEQTAIEIVTFVREVQAANGIF